MLKWGYYQFKKTIIVGLKSNWVFHKKAEVELQVEVEHKFSCLSKQHLEQWPWNVQMK